MHQFYFPLFGVLFFFFSLFCRRLKKRRLFLITVLHSINEHQQCANERDGSTWTRCARTAFNEFLQAPLFICRLLCGELEMGKDKAGKEQCEILLHVGTCSASGSDLVLGWV